MSDARRRAYALEATKTSITTQTAGIRTAIANGIPGGFSHPVLTGAKIYVVGNTPLVAGENVRAREALPEFSMIAMSGEITDNGDGANPRFTCVCSAESFLNVNNALMIARKIPRIPGIALNGAGTDNVDIHLEVIAILGATDAITR